MKGKVYLKTFINLPNTLMIMVKKQEKKVARKKKASKKEPKKEDKKLINAYFIRDHVITECSNEARNFYERSRYGTLLEDGRVQLTLIEAYYLYDRGKIKILRINKVIDKDAFLRKCIRQEKNFWIRYAVYADFRNRGYIIKTALKFGADFRVYDKGIKPGEDHARWIVYPVKETHSLTWYEFAAKNRVAHSTKKRLLIGVVDEENSVTYYEVKWTRP
jgi:tRNA-intron endonuclease